MTELLYGPALWSRIRRQANIASRRHAAVAYVGQRAEELVAFSAGDIIVIDATDAALRSGATNPEAVAAWLRAGADVHSYEGLHAKVLVLGRTIVIGSANLSWHSHDNLLEAAVVGTDTAMRRDVIALIQHLVSTSLEQVDQAWVHHARRIYRPSRLPMPGARPGTSPGSLLPPGPFRLTISSWRRAAILTQSEARHDQRTHQHLRPLRGPARQYEVETWVVDSDDDVEAGQVVVLVEFDSQGRETGPVSSPARVLRVVPLSPRRTGAYLRRDLTLPDIDLGRAQNTLRRAGGRWSYDRSITSPKARAALLGLWGLRE